MADPPGMASAQLRGGVFADPARERACVGANWPMLSARARELALSGGTGLLLLGLVDLALLGPTAIWGALLAARIAVGVSALALWRTARGAAQPRRLRRRLLAFEALAAALMLADTAALPLRAAAPAMAALTLLAALYVYAPLLTPAALWIGPAFSLGFVGLLLRDPAHAPAAWAAALLTLVNLGGRRIALQQAGFLRLAWLDREALRRAVADRARIGSALRASEARLRLLFDAAPLPMLLVRQHDAALLRHNAAASRWLQPLDRAASTVARLCAGLRVDEATRYIELPLGDGVAQPRDALLSARVLDIDGEACVLVGMADVASLHDAQRGVAGLAEIDALTALPNRRGFAARTRALLRQTTPLALLLLDLDHFKRINAIHGVGVGDEVLVQVGALLGHHMRHGDVMGRHGGEEFVALLGVASRATAREAAERLRAYIEAHPFATSVGVLRLSVSIGLVLRETGPSTPDALAALLALADAALDRAKQRGRNRVEMHE